MARGAAETVCLQQSLNQGNGSSVHPSPRQGQELQARPGPFGWDGHANQGLGSIPALLCVGATGPLDREPTVSCSAIRPALL